MAVSFRSSCIVATSMGTLVQARNIDDKKHGQAFFIFSSYLGHMSTILEGPTCWLLACPAVV